MVDSAGNPIQILNPVTSSLGIPPSVNPALIDPNTGQLLLVAQPTVTSKMSLSMELTLIVAGLAALVYFTKGK